MEHSLSVRSHYKQDTTVQRIQQASSAGTLSLMLSLLLLVPAFMLSNWNRHPAKGIFVHVRTAALPVPQVAPGIVVHVRARKAFDPDGRFLGWGMAALEVDGRVVEWNALGARLRGELAKRAQNTVYVSGDDENSWGDVVTVMDAIRSETGWRIVLLGRERVLP